MISVGYSVRLYTYHPELITNLPKGVELRPASEVFPFERVVFHKKTGSVSLFSNFFRYRGLQMGLGIWVDADMLLLKPLEDLGDVICGWQDKSRINGAVLHLPRDHPFLNEYLELMDSSIAVPPTWTTLKKARQNLRGWVGLQRKVEEMRWGTFGPLAITYGAKKYGFVALDPAVFYPLPPESAEQVFNPHYDVHKHIEKETRALHLWNERIKIKKIHPPAPGSFMNWAQQRYLSASAN